MNSSEITASQAPAAAPLDRSPHGSAPARTTRVAVLGSTGSIGRNALEVIESSPGALEAVVLTAHSNTALLLEQAQRVGPECIVVTDPQAAARQDWSTLPSATRLMVGSQAVVDVVSSPAIDVVLTAIVGSAGLRGTWAAVEAGKRIALANKETLVMAGSLVTQLASRRGARILPVDSEHSAVFQALAAGRRADLRRIVLTASGGPFRRHSPAQLAQVTVADALAHPTWKMGAKITVDSATMMNKALEIIEARWLFDLRPDQIEVVIHPQSVVHSLVEFVDGSVLAQLSPPDMRLPIQYALTYPRRLPGVARQLDWRGAWSLEFEPPDFDRFPALALGLGAARSGGTSGAVLNAANEAAVERFLAGQIGFTEIVPACRSVLEQHHFESQPTLARLWELDGWARQEVGRWTRS